MSFETSLKLSILRVILRIFTLLIYPVKERLPASLSRQKKSALRNCLLAFICLYGCSVAIAQKSDLVEKYVEPNRAAHSHYYVVKNDALTNSQLRKRGSFVRALDSSHYIVAEKDTIYADQVIGPANDTWKFPLPSYPGSLRFPATLLMSLRESSKKTELDAIGVRIIRQHGSEIEVLVKSNAELKKIHHLPGVLFIKSAKPAREETSATLQDLSVNKINFAHREFPNVNGDGVTIGLKEKSLDTTDMDLKNRIVLSELADDEISLHANMIATLISGAGNSSPSAKGVAPKSQIVSSSFDNLLPDDDAVLNKYKVTVQNHSYGTEIENFYGPEAVAYDRSVVENPTRVHVFSAGNSGQQTPTQGTYASMTRLANLTGNMKMSKNLLTIGAHSLDFTIDARNSRGPAYDGRIKPEVTAYGPDGTSDAAAFVSGICALLQQRYKQINGVLPSVDIVKAALVTTADDIGPPGVDFITGFGSANAYKAIKLIDDRNVFTGTLSSGQVSKFQVNVPTGMAKLKVAISWIDPPAIAGSSKALTNDLDIKVKDISGNVQWLPWVLSSYPHIDSLMREEKRGVDHLNNVELVSVNNPAAGAYEFEVRAFDVQTASQGFALTYWFEPADSFLWTYPTTVDPVKSGQETFFRWDSALEGTGTIELWGGGVAIETKQVELNKGFSAFTIPTDVSGNAKAIMKINNQEIASADFVISPQIALKVEFNCESTGMISWPVVRNAAGYKLYALGNMYMEEIATTTDTTFQVTKDVTAYYAVAPLFSDRQGIRSATYNINEQGVNCYYTNFFATATSDGQGQLVLNLSTRYNIDKIIWQRLDNGNFIDVGSTQVDDKLNYVFLDESMNAGVTQFRAIIETKSGEFIQTEVSTVYYADDRTFAVFPNPIDRQTELNILTDAQDVNIRFYDRQGQLVKFQDVPFDLFRIDVSDLTPGLYLFSIQRGPALVSSGRLLVK